MKKIGLIGGISWHATSKYYEYINSAVNQFYGNNTNPPLLIFNVNQARMHALQVEGRWDAIAEMITDAAISLEKAGAELLLICSNTTHKILNLVEPQVQAPFIHIVDSTAEVIRRRGHQTIGFIGTRFGMQDEFLVNKLSDYGLETILPESNATILELHRIIQEELTYNKVTSTSKVFVNQVIAEMKHRGAEGLILGCTEYSLMFEHMQMDIPVFDTLTLHAQSAVDYLLKGEKELV